MGEVVDFNEYETVEVTPDLEISPHIVEMAVNLLKNGRSRNSIKLKLRDLGYSLSDAEKILTQAETAAFSKPKPKSLNFPVIFLGFILFLIVIVFVAYIYITFTTGPVDCGDDNFCVSKILTCEEGKYISGYRGLTNEYIITNRDNYCQVFVKVSQSSLDNFPTGMNMNCLYPLIGSQSQMASDYSDCEGSLALALSV